jgi:hypothetical protein
MISHRDRASQGVKGRGTKNIDTPEEQEAEEEAQKRGRGRATTGTDRGRATKNTQTHLREAGGFHHQNPY